MTNENKKNGNKFEQDFCKALSHYGFWAHNFVQSSAGQPADIIAVKNQKAFLIDCKVCSGKSFNMSRIEDNQLNSMRLWSSKGNGDGYFAFLIEEEVYILPLSMLLFLKLGRVTLPTESIKESGLTVPEWVKKCKLS